ncbi:MAG: efflux transporter outer membrane subunit [Comamonadaceae bacterium]|nr:efflux transporter outer membrane subunit [Comamonadaceae bacterium]
MIWKIVSTASMLFLVACAPTQDFVRPQLPVPTQWARAGGDLQAAASKTHWRAFFTEPQLQQLIEVALANNRDLRIAAGRVQEARAQFGMARADTLPSLNVLGSGNLTRTTTDLSGTNAPLTSQRFDLGVSSVSYEIDFWGRLASLTDAARLSYLATEESRRSVYLSLISDVALSYLNLLQYKELIADEQATVALREYSLLLIHQGYQAGAANDFEYQQARSLLETAQATLASYDHQLTVARNQLNFLLGNAAFDLKLGARLDQQGLDKPLSTALPAEVLLLRPDVMAAEQRLRAMHANIAAARAAFLPKVMLTATLGLASQGLASLFSGGAWAFQPLITMPLFDGGRTAAGVDLAEARKVVAVAEYERAIQVAFREVADLLAARKSLALQLEAVRVGVQAQRRRLEIAQGRFEAGASGYLEVLEAQRELIGAQQRALQLRRTQLESNVQLYKALGGGIDSVQ